jgi:hypothetical protein
MRSWVASPVWWKMQGRPSGSSACSLLDDLVGPREHRRRDRQAERLGGRPVDHEIELRGLLDGQVAGLGALRPVSAEGGTLCFTLR